MALSLALHLRNGWSEAEVANNERALGPVLLRFFALVPAARFRWLVAPSRELSLVENLQDGLAIHGFH